MKLITDFDPQHGQANDLGTGISRVTARNSGPFTFHGTNTYLIGTQTLAIIDPGPDRDDHFQVLIASIGGRPVSHIFVTHTHKDHTALLPRLVAATGAKTVAEGPHRLSRPLRDQEISPLDASSDWDFKPDIVAREGEKIHGLDWAIEPVLTPGHTANHCAYSLVGANILFSGDHVMAWATTIVAPPDGSMSDYMASLDALLLRDDKLYLPGHGGSVKSPKSFVKALKTHRKMRERAVLQRILAGDRTVAGIVSAIYRDIDPRLFGAASLSVLAHIEDLIHRKQIRSDGALSLDASYFPG